MQTWNNPRIYERLSELVKTIDAKFETVKHTVSMPIESGFGLSVSEEPYTEPKEWPYRVCDTLLWRFEGSAKSNTDEKVAGANTDEEAHRLIDRAYADAERLIGGPILLWRLQPKLIFDYDFFEQKIRIALIARAYIVEALQCQPSN